MLKRLTSGSTQTRESQSTITESLAKRGGWFVLVVSSVCTVVAILLGAWPWDFLRDATTITTIRNIVVAAAVPPSVVMALWRASVAQTNADTAQRNSNTERRKLHNDRFQEGVRMLTGTATIERVAGVSALRHLVLIDPDQYLAPVMDMLAAFIRHHAGTDSQYKKGNYWEIDSDCIGSGKGYGSCPHQPRVEIVEAIKTLSDCLARDTPTLNQGHRHIDLRHIDLHGLRLNELCLAGVDLSGSTLMHSQIVDVSFRGSILEDTNLGESNLGGGDFCHARLSRANFSRSRLRAARFIGADLQWTKFISANAQRVYFCCSNCFMASFELAELSECHFESSPTNIDLPCYDSIGESATERTDLSHACFNGSTLDDATFGDATITETEFLSVRTSDNCEAPVRGLSRSQLSDVQFDPCRPPTFDGVIDAQTGQAFDWSGGAVPESTGDEDDG